MSLLTLGLIFIAAIGSIWCFVQAFRGEDGGDDEPGSDGGGPGWGRSRPPKPPPDTPVCWTEFERQFAEHVEALGALDDAPRPRGEQVGSRFAHCGRCAAVRARRN